MHETLSTVSTNGAATAIEYGLIIAYAVDRDRRRGDRLSA